MELTNDQVAVRLFEIRQEYQAEVDAGCDNNLPGLANEAANLVMALDTKLGETFQTYLTEMNTIEAIDLIIEQVESL